MKKQRGTNIIALMVGSVISLLVVAAMMVVYRSAIKNVYGDSAVAGSNGMVANAKQDGQLASGILLAQNILLGAGFGVAAPTSNAQILAFSGATWNGTTLAGTQVNIVPGGVAANALVWVSRTAINGAVTNCWAMVGDAGTKALTVLRSINPACAVPTLAPNGGWVETTLVSAGLLSANFGFTVSSAQACVPYGVIPAATTSVIIPGLGGTASPTGGVVVTMTYANSSTGATSSYRMCLTNFVN